jgi:PAS domain S-box-containing protein
MARVEGRALEAMELYEDAIRSAQANGFVQVEAVASELAGRFYSGRGFEKIARTYLDAARSCYVRWGADGKVRQFEQLYPQCNAESRGTGPAGTTIETSLEHLDLATVINMSQAVSSEIVLDKLIDSLMRTAITQAGAARGLLILAHAAEPRVAAQASTVGDSIHVEPCDVPVSGSVLPQMVLSKVLRTRESVILDDAESEAPYAADPYISSVRARSILCVPLINQAKLVGVFYLENDLAARVFVPQRITVVKLLASQAAVALENSRLYRELAEREARIRRLVDANIIGIFIYDRHGGILEANEAFLGMVGYDRQELLSGRIHWQTLTPPDRKDIGTMRPLEMQLCRRDGSRVPVLVGAADFEPDGNQGVAFVLDLTERKQAERAAQESERRYHDLNLQLAHANRVLSIGELSASIAHEINQPLAGIIVNADTGLSMLDDDPPNLGIVRETISRTIRDANRASAVIIRLRALFANKETQFDALDLNQLIRDVAALSMSETNRMGVELRLQLQADLPPVRGDLVQLQQVVLNLLRNGSQAMANVEERRRVLTISTELAHPEGAVVTVQDVGVGFDSEREAKLFQAFYTTKSDGMGIGLSVSRSIIAHHRGRIWAQRNDGPGATFAFVIPLA